MTRDSNGYAAKQIWLTAKEKYFGWLSRLKWLKLQLILRLAMPAILAIMAITANFVIDFVTLQAVFYVESEKKAGTDEIPSSFIYFSLFNFRFPLSMQNSACIFTKPIAKLAVITVKASIAGMFR